MIHAECLALMSVLVWNWEYIRVPHQGLDKALKAWCEATTSKFSHPLGVLGTRAAYYGVHASGTLWVHVWKLTCSLVDQGQVPAKWMPA